MNRIDEFINQFEAKATKRSYTYHLNHFFNCLDTNSESYFTSKRDYEEDIRRYWKCLKDASYSRGTRNSRLNAVKQFLLYNDVELSIKFWKSLRKSAMDKGQRPETIDFAPTPVHLRKILDHANTLSRAAILILSSSGMRISELCQILPTDLKINNDPPIINLRGKITKTKSSRYVFISYEAKEALEAWLRERDTWLERASRKMINIHGIDKNADDPRVFPMTMNHIRLMYNRLLKRAELDERDQNTKMQFRIYHLHTLRKYFRTYLTPAIEGGSDVVHALMGHEEYLDAAYQRYNLEQLSGMYKKAMKSIAVYEREADLSGINEQLKEVTQDNKELQQQLNDIRMELLEVKLKQVQELQRKKG